ncbi:uncharacterized protein [Oscarella lobularis]|uniref:uncharacterized protein n=1 Tax=Oscarella lobularis TaxID=121494 RepID=UPI003313C3D1
MLCENTIGGHTCKCQSGYQVALNGLSCLLTQCGDFDYLSNATTSVHFSESDRRVNSTASIVCEQGYSMNNGTNSISLRCLDDGSWDGNPVSCKDIDECSKSLDSCDSDEVCHNTEGSYECQRNEPSPTSQTNEPSPTSQTNEPQPTSQTNEPQPTSQPNEPQLTSQPKEPQPTSQPNEPTSQSSPCSDGETNDCVSDDPNAKNIAAGGSEQTYVYIGIAIGCLLLLIVVVIIVVVACRRHRRALNVPSTPAPAMVLAAADADHVYDRIVRPGENERLYEDVPRSIASQSSRTRLCSEKGVEVGNPLYGFSGMNQPGESNQE